MAGHGPAALFDLCSTGQYSDFTVACKEREFGSRYDHAHNASRLGQQQKQASLWREIRQE
jgi:hypothetical protein